MTVYRYTADRAARALWGPVPVPFDGALCARVVGGRWRRNQLVEFASGMRVIVPWTRLRKVA